MCAMDKGRVSTAVRRAGSTRPRLHASTSRADRATAVTSVVVTVISTLFLAADLDVVQDSQCIGYQDCHRVICAHQVGNNRFVIDAHEPDVESGLHFVGNSGLV